MTKSYGQFCGLARALDVVGDRWSLLIVRQLLVAPARYGELLAGLPGVATNLLSTRLRDLESAGVVERRLARDANAVEYTLTEWGSGLREPIDALIRWSEPLMIPGRGSDQFQVEWLMVALPALLRDKQSSRKAINIGFAVDETIVQVQASRSGVDVGLHDGRKLAAILRAEPLIALGLAAGSLSLDDVASSVSVEGDETALRAVLAP
jgi:DNA-binding HxlR family transcriptional regulator